MVFITLAASVLPLRGATSFVDYELLPGNTLRLTTIENSAGYYVVQESTNLDDYEAIDIGLGIDSPMFDIALEPSLQPRGFYRVRSISLFAPEDSDGDRIDDVYELNRPHILDPLDPSDALLDPDQNGLTHLDEYLRFLLDTTAPPQFYSGEISAFNLGAERSIASRELTMFNFGLPPASVEANSRIVSVYRGLAPPLVSSIPQVYSRGVSAYNFGEAPNPTEAISRSISVYNGSAPPTTPSLPQVYAREISIVNLGAPTSPVEAISREISINALAPTEP